MHAFDTAMCDGPYAHIHEIEEKKLSMIIRQAPKSHDNLH